jgi:acyl-CoA synthetase (AMP-forming)/AMP-acid ligase II/Leucine-rich repeat (LRR) protein
MGDDGLAAAGDAYTQALSAVQAAARAVRDGAAAAAAGTASQQPQQQQLKQELQNTRQRLARCKAELAALKKRQQAQIIDGLGSRAYWSHQPDHPAWLSYPAPRQVPLDDADTRWTVSFDAFSQRDEARTFWDEWGFVVFRGVLAPDECQKTVAEIWDTLEAQHAGLSRDDPSTFGLLPAKRYGLPDEQAVFTPQIVKNRQSPRVYAALDAITPPWPPGSNDRGNDDGAPPAQPGPSSVRLSQDRWCLYPPALGRPNRQTTNPGAHLDICPWQYLPRADRRYDADTDLDELAYDGPTRVRQLCDFRAEINGVRGECGGPHNQGVLNLVDNEAEDGGTAVVPGFHKVYREWSEALGKWEVNRVGQRRRGNAFVFGNPFDPIHKLMRRVTMRAGSLVLWNQCTVHGAVPNASNNLRVAQFLRGFRAGEVSHTRATRRAAAIRRELHIAGLMEQLTPLAPHVFDLECERPLEPVSVSAGSGQSACKIDQSLSSVSDGQAWHCSWPRQLSDVEASRFAFSHLMDLIPDDDGQFLLPIHPDVDNRMPLTFKGLRQFGRNLQADAALANVAAGSRIAVSLPSIPELAVCFLALTTGGKYSFAPLNPGMSESEVSFQLTDLPAAAVIVLKGKHGPASRAASTHSVRVIELEPDEHVCGIFSLHRIDSDQPTASSNEPPSSMPGRDVVALLMHTSGTTRRPKLVPLSHGQLGIGALCVASTLQLRRGQSLAINIMPLHHLHGLMISVLVSAVSGTGLVCAPRFDPSLFFDWLQPTTVGYKETNTGSRQSTLAPTWYSAVPTMHQEVLRTAEQYHRAHGKAPPHRLTLIRNCSAALAPSVGEQLERLLGVTVLTSYAMTEALPICSNRLPNNLGGVSTNLDSVGPGAGPQVQVISPIRISGSEGKALPLPTGEVGEVAVRGLCVFRGYELRKHLGYNPNEHTFTSDGWFRTGDKGFIDSNGHLHLTGRFKEIINRAGEKISPVTIEHELLALSSSELSGLQSVLVFAAPHSELGETVGVGVVCSAGITISLLQLRRALGGTKKSSTRQSISRQWLPEIVVHLSSIPQGPTGKPARIGFAERLGIPELSFAETMRTVDLRGRKSMEYEASRRAKARIESSQRSAARQQLDTRTSIDQTAKAEIISLVVQCRRKELKEAGSMQQDEPACEDRFEKLAGELSGLKMRALRQRALSEGVDESAMSTIIASVPSATIICSIPPDEKPSADTMAGCVQMVALAMAEATGATGLCVTDDLFDAGLSSISASRLRQELDLRSGLRKTLPPNLAYDHPTLGSLAAALFLRKSSEATALDSNRIGSHQDQRSIAVLTAEASQQCQIGSLQAAEALCMRATRCAGLADEWPDAEVLEPPVEVAMSELVPPLSLLLAIWSRLGSQYKAANATRLLLIIKVKLNRTSCVDMALLWGQLAQLLVLCNDEAAASEAAANALSAAAKDLSVHIGSTERTVSFVATKSSSACGSDQCKDICTDGLSCVQHHVAALVSSRCEAQTPLCAYCSSLHTLVLRRQQLAQLLSCIGELPLLRILDISDNCIRQLPADTCYWGRLGNLCELHLASNQLERLPCCLPNTISALKVLNLQDNRFRSLPLIVYKFELLETLRWGLQKQCSHGTDARVDKTGPPETLSSASLRVLELQGNNASSLHLAAGKTTCQLHTVLASHNCLGRFPDCLVNYGATLKRLHLGSNNLVCVEPVLSVLTRLTCLMLEGNRLQQLPACIGCLHELRELAIYGNLLKVLPEELGNCSSLTILDAHHNLLETLPDTMSSLINLKSLYLQSNCLGRQNGLEHVRTSLVDHLPMLANLGLGSNYFDLSEAFERRGTRVGLAWNPGEPSAAQLRGVLTDQFATVDHLYEPMCQGTRGEILVVGFAAQGAGTASAS